MITDGQGFFSNEQKVKHGVTREITYPACPLVDSPVCLDPEKSPQVRVYPSQSHEFPVRVPGSEIPGLPARVVKACFGGVGPAVAQRRGLADRIALFFGKTQLSCKAGKETDKRRLLLVLDCELDILDNCTLAFCTDLLGSLEGDK